MARIAFRVTMEGDREAVARLRKIAAEGDKGVRKEARLAALAVAQENVPKMRDRTPEKTGALKASEHAKAGVSPKREDIRISLIAGGAAAPYARIVHETHPTKGQFMLNTLLDMARTAAAEIGAKIDIERAAQ